MKRNWINGWLDILLALGLWSLALTGLIMRYVLPPGSGWRRALWGLNRHDWGNVHFWLSLGVGTLLTMHLALHWQWIGAMFPRLFRRGNVVMAPPSPARRNAAGPGLLLAVAVVSALFFWLVQNRVVEGGRPGRGWGREHATSEAPARAANTPQVRGWMVLVAEASAASTTHGDLGTPIKIRLAKREDCGLTRQLPEGVSKQSQMSAITL